MPPAQEIIAATTLVSPATVLVLVLLSLAIGLTAAAAIAIAAFHMPASYWLAGRRHRGRG